MGGDNSLFQHSQAYSGRRQSHNETWDMFNAQPPITLAFLVPNFKRQVLAYDYVGFLSLERLDPTHSPLYLTFACCVLHFLVFEPWQTTRSGIYQTP